MNYKNMLIWLLKAIPDEAIPDLKELADDMIDIVETKWGHIPSVKGACEKLRSGADIPDDVGGDPD